MKYVYSFIEGNKDLKDLLGGKGANLAEMKSMGLPVPDGFTITTSACNKYYLDGEKIDDEVIEQIMEQIEVLEHNTNKKFGDLTNPLLVSVRSGAPVSMPGMMDTILNLGLNDSVAESFSKITNNPRFVYDSYRRFIQMFSDVVMGYPKSNFERIMDEYKKLKGVSNDSELDSSDMIEITNKFKTIYKELSGSDFPQDPRVQLIESVKAVFRSWNNERAIIYRKMNDIKSDLGTAVNVQEMVYGNLSNNSATGVAFTRNPATGENKLYGEFLINAQGEDVVAGIRTPLNIDELKNVMPDIYNEFLNFNLTRSDLIIALGGGVIGDLAGFAASTYLRGIDFIQIPTSLLAQVDSSVGGKVAVDLERGKNLVGSFYHPKCVLIDPQVLSTLNDKFFADGMGEVIKYGCIKDSNFFEFLYKMKDNEQLMSNMEEVIYKCCDIKRQVVERDEKDKGERMLLNFGHTLGHSIEQYYNYEKYTHGEAVAIGMYMITKISEEKGLTKKETAEKIKDILIKYNLPYEVNVNLKELLEAINLDKKKMGNDLNIIVLKEIGNSEIYKTTISFFS